jgi:hypothetical protein
MTIAVMTSNKTFTIATRIRKWLTKGGLAGMKWLGVAVDVVASATCGGPAGIIETIAMTEQASDDSGLTLEETTGEEATGEERA